MMQDLNNRIHVNAQLSSSKELFTMQMFSDKFDIVYTLNILKF